MGDWIDNINPAALAPKPTASGGATGDWIDNIDPAALAGNEPSIAARGAGFPGPEPSFYERYVAPYIPPLHAPLDAQGQPIATPISQGTQLIGDVALHANPLLALGNAGFVGTQHLFNAISSKLGGPTKDVFNPLEAVANVGDLTPDPNAGTAMKTAHEVGPWLVPSGNQLGRVGEAPGLFNKAMTLGRSEVGNVIDWAASDAFQKQAEAQGWGPLAQMISGAVGGNVRQGIIRLVATQVPKVITAQPGAGVKIDVSKKLLPTPGTRGTSDRGPGVLPPFRDVADPNTSVASFVSGAGAIPFSGTGETGAVRAQTGAIARTADAGLNALDPGTTPVMEAGPSSLKDEGSALATQARAKILTEEHQLMANSDAIDSQVGDTRVDATPLRTAAESLYTDPNVGTTVQGQAKRVLDNINANTAPDGSIGYGALKNERSAFNQFIDGLYQAPTGDVTVKNTLARALQPIKQAMSDTMGAAADAAGGATGNPDLGAQFRQNDAAWSTHSAIKRQLADIGGTLNQSRTGFDPAPGGKKVASILTNSVQGGGQGIAPIQNIEGGLGEQPARSAVAETVAAMGTPKKAESDYAFQPSTFGKGVQNIDPEAMDYIEAKAGPGARTNLENAAEAGAGTSQPPKQGGLRRTLGGIVGAAPYAAPVLFGAHAALSPLVAMLTSASHDPDLLRAVAGRSVPMMSGDLAAQMRLHAALGTRPNAVSPMEALRYGAGQAANAAGSVLPALMQYVHSATGPGGQR